MFAITDSNSLLSFEHKMAFSKFFLAFWDSFTSSLFIKIEKAFLYFRNLLLITK